MPRIFDCFILDDELDILEDRFRELEEIPGLVHVICEAPVTARGTPKPLWFWENRGRFTRWGTRWNHVKVEPYEMRARTPEERAARQREYLLHGFNGEPGDILLYGDVCDIPDPVLLDRLTRRKTLLPVMTDGLVACRRRDVTTIKEMEEMWRLSVT